MGAANRKQCIRTSHNDMRSRSSIDLRKAVADLSREPEVARALAGNNPLIIEIGGWKAFMMAVKRPQGQEGQQCPDCKEYYIDHPNVAGCTCFEIKFGWLRPEIT